jgi:hypothetical protein
MLDFDRILDREGLSGPILAKRKAKVAAKKAAKAAPRPATAKPAAAPKPAQKKVRGLIKKVKARVQARKAAKKAPGLAQPKTRAAARVAKRVEKRRLSHTVKITKTPKKPIAPINKPKPAPKAARKPIVGRLGPALLARPPARLRPVPALVPVKPPPAPASLPSPSGGGSGGGGGGGGGGKGPSPFDPDEDDLDEESEEDESEEEEEDSSDYDADEDSGDFEDNVSEEEPEEEPEEEEEEDSDMELGALEQATNLAIKAITPLAAKPRHSHNHHNRAKRALSAVAPIADAYGTPAAAVIRSVDARLIPLGYPPGTAATLFAALSDLNDSLEAAAKDKIASLPTAEASVLRQLANVAQKLPRCHPTRTRAHLNIVRHRG